MGGPCWPWAHLIHMQSLDMLEKSNLGLAKLDTKAHTCFYKHLAPVSGGRSVVHCGCVDAGKTSACDW